MENEELKKALETLLFITDRPLTKAQLCKITGVKDVERIAALVLELQQECEARGSALQLLEVADGFQMATRPAYAPFVRKLFSERMTMRLSNASLETLSIVAYKQPLTRAEVEEIRGVEVIAALETLLEKGLLKVVGRKETVGRPLMYGTTVEFMRHFGLKSLEELPPLESLEVEPVEKATPQGPFTPLAVPVLEEPADPAVVEAFVDDAAEVPAEASTEEVSTQSPVEVPVEDGEPKEPA